MLGRQIPGLEIPQEKKFGIKWNRKAALYYYMTQNSLSGEKKKIKEQFVKGYNIPYKTKTH